MRTYAITASLLLSAGLLVLAPLPGVSDPSSTIEITAVPSKFTPDTIVLHAGQTTRLDFKNVEGVHGIESSDLGVPQTVLSPGKDTTVDVTPSKPGTYVLHCQIVCGTDHPNMTLTVKVEA